MPNLHFYGYRYKNGRFTIVPEEADIVRQIFADCVAGMTFKAIAEKLNTSGVPVRRSGVWFQATVSKIVRNKKYAGTDIHEAIISADTFKIVASMTFHHIAKRNHAHVFSGLIRCSHCNDVYIRWFTGGGTPYRKLAWKCRTSARRGKNVCPARQIPEDVLEDKIADALDMDKFDADIFSKIAVSVIFMYINSESDRLDIMISFDNGKMIKSTTAHNIAECRKNTLRRQLPG